MICMTLVFDSATGLAGLATKLLVLSRSRLSFTQPTKSAKPAKFFCCTFTVLKRAKNANWDNFPKKSLSLSLNSGLDVRWSSQYYRLSIGFI
jgi:hypothetical protein